MLVYTFTKSAFNGLYNKTMKTDPKERCLELARKSTFRTRHGSVIVHNGKIIGSGFNINLTHPMIKVYNEFKTLHAEMVAIMRVKNKQLLKDSSIYVARINAKGLADLSKPCCTCMEFIKNTWKIKNIYYTDQDGDWVKLDS